MTADLHIASKDRSLTVSAGTDNGKTWLSENYPTLTQVDAPYWPVDLTTALTIIDGATTERLRVTAFTD